MSKIGILITSVMSLVLFWQYRKKNNSWKQLKGNGIKTTGIVENVKVEADRDGINYRVTVKFKTFDGQFVVKEIITTDDFYQKGLSVRVLYDGNDPLRSAVNDDDVKDDKGCAIIFLSASIVFAAIAFFMIFFMLK
jgi:hypothetical protein